MLGQTGGGAGNGGNVTITANSSGTITTNANFSAGIFAQSVGGGGGASTAPISTSLMLGSASGGWRCASTPTPALPTASL